MVNKNKFDQGGLKMLTMLRQTCQMLDESKPRVQLWRISPGCRCSRSPRGHQLVVSGTTISPAIWQSVFTT